jgi:hypothetical protein
MSDNSLPRSLPPQGRSGVKTAPAVADLKALVEEAADYADANLSLRFALVLLGGAMVGTALLLMLQGVQRRWLS